MDYKSFAIPDENYFPRPLWFWNDRPTKERIDDMLNKAKTEMGYSGFGILPYDACRLTYMGEEYLCAYEYTLEKAKENGLKLCLYDEWWFPSGSAGGLLKKRYPESCARELVKTEYDVDSHITVQVPEGTLMSAVAMNMNTKHIIDLRSKINNDLLSWETEENGWRVMFFTCVLSEWDHVNYLDPKAVSRFVEVTHEAYFKRFGKYFGDTIDSSFYDEPQMYAVGGRMWVDNFNELFAEKYNVSPEKLYPALWYDIGENTASARCMFHTLRAQLYATGFPKVVQKWCSEHNISLTGHVDQEEVINPTGITGDLMKSFKYQDIPGFDEIIEPGRGRKIYKIISSAAYNWDKKLVMSECYGAMPEDTSVEIMYDEAMEQFAKGMNMLVPHAVWTVYEKEKIIYNPELSWRNERYHGVLKPFNEYCARIMKLLRGGRHIADIAVLYPIYGLNASYYFEWGDPYLGGPAKDCYNYQQIGEWLSDYVRKDFTFLHPEVLEEKCSIDGNIISLHNDVNYENYKVLILPGTEVMSLGNLQKAKSFYEQGGVVIAAGKLPVYSAEPGMDDELREIIDYMFACNETDLPYVLKKSNAKGKSWYVPEPTAELLDEVLEKSGIEYDVCLKTKQECEGVVTYMHKKRGEQDIYYFVNCNETCVQLEISLQSEQNLEIWNPHNGERCEIDNILHRDNGRQCFELSLKSHSSLMVVSK